MTTSASDPAILSRVTLELKYSDLNAELRKVIWTTMSAFSGLSGVEDRQLNELAEPCLNGRQIRNLVRLAKLLYENSDANVQQLKEIASNAVEHNKLAASKSLGDKAN